MNFTSKKTSKWWIQACDRKPLPGEGDTTFLPPSLWVMALPDCSLPASTVVGYSFKALGLSGDAAFWCAKSRI